MFNKSTRNSFDTQNNDKQPSQQTAKNITKNLSSRLPKNNSSNAILSKLAERNIGDIIYKEATNEYISKLIEYHLIYLMNVQYHC